MKMIIMLNRLIVKIFGKPESNTIFAIGTNPDGKAEGVTSGDDRTIIEVLIIQRAIKHQKKQQFVY